MKKKRIFATFLSGKEFPEIFSAILREGIGFLYEYRGIATNAMGQCQRRLRSAAEESKKPADRNFMNETI